MPQRGVAATKGPLAQSSLRGQRIPLCLCALGELCARLFALETRRNAFALHVSGIVLEELAAGDREAAQRRLQAAAAGIHPLDANPQAEALAGVLLKGRAIPAQAGADVVHVAIAAVHRMEFLLTWNCRHIHNALMYPVIQSVCQKEGYVCPVSGKASRDR